MQKRSEDEMSFCAVHGGYTVGGDRSLVEWPLDQKQVRAAHSNAFLTPGQVLCRKSYHQIEWYMLNTTPCQRFHSYARNIPTLNNNDNLL